MVDANDGFRTSPATYYNSAPNFNADVLREEEDAQYNLPQKNMLQNLKDYLPFIGDKSITGMLTRGIGQFFNNIGDRIPSTPQYQQYTPGYNYGNLNPNLIDDFYDPNLERYQNFFLKEEKEQQLKQTLYKEEK
jgi:hypothetical protein